MCDPDLPLRFVKQNFENDLSVMSIVRSRGRSEVLVLVGLEEMGIYDAGADPNMRDTCRLLSQRFSGR